MHIAWHHVSPEDVAEVCRGEPVVLAGYEERVVLVGPKTSRRAITVVLGPEASDPKAF